MILQLTILLLVSTLTRATSGSLAQETLEQYRSDVKKTQQESWGEPDKKVGERLSKLTPDAGQNPDELGSYLEGDMLIIMPEDLPLGTRFAETDPRFRWPDAIVYYSIDGDFNSEQKARILSGISEFHKHTCIRFKPYTGSEKDYILIQSKNTGCWSALGRTGGKQIVNLQPPGCVSQVGVAMHEIMHALGIFHEQSRSDRDDFVNIQWQNIEHGKEHNFKQHKYFGLGMKYDYGSLMHYSITAFSKNKQPTISTRLKTGDQIGQRKGFSEGDIQKINRLYCDSKTDTKVGENSIEDTKYVKSQAKKPYVPNYKPISVPNKSSVPNKPKYPASRPSISSVIRPPPVDQRPSQGKYPLTSGGQSPIITSSGIYFGKNQGGLKPGYEGKENIGIVREIQFERKTTIDPRLIDWVNKYQST